MLKGVPSVGRATMMTTTPPVPTLTPLARFDLTKLNQRFEKSHPKAILAWCVEHLSPGLVQASTFNVDDMLITDLLYRDLQPTPPVPVIFLDTLFHFKETLELVELTRQIYANLDLNIYKPLEAKTRKHFKAKFGDALWHTNLVQFHEITKIEPLMRSLQELNALAWITARRRDHAGTSDDLPIFELDSLNRLKVNPLATWTRKETWAYVFEYDVAYNPLHDQGYDDIGDKPLTLRSAAAESISLHPWTSLQSLNHGVA